MEKANILAKFEAISNMEQAQYYWFIALLLFFFPVYKLLLHIFKYPKNLPPSPPALPFLGHLHLLKPPLHRSLHHLSQKYGKTMLLQFGWRKVLIISSPSAVEECFTKNDIVFANRPKLLSGVLLNYHNRTIGLASYGDYWRNLRRLTAIEMFSSKSLAAYAKIRHQEVVLLVKKLYQDYCRTCMGGHKFYMKVKLRQVLVDTLLNIMMRMLVGKRYFGTDEESEEGREFKEIIHDLVELLDGTAYVGDYISIMKVVDVFQGVKRKMSRVKKKLDVFLQGLVDEQRRFRNRNSRGNKGDEHLLGRMLSLQETDPEFYTDETIKATIMAILTAGSETSSTTIEWAMALLLNHPKPMLKAYNAINSLVGRAHIINESDTLELQYLQSIINETLRLFPSAPLLLPHESSTDCFISSFHIPRNTMLLVNSWSIHRDPEVWSDAESFMPERFEINDDKVNTDWSYQFLPFGVGRRACPGAVLGKRVIGMVLGALIQCFEWQKVSEVINMSEGIGLSMPPSEELEALIKPHEDMIQLLSKA